MDKDKQARMETLLEYLTTNEVALPAKPLHDNLVLYRDIDFTYRTTKRYLVELQERGLIEYIDRGKGYYRVTDAGQYHVTNQSE